ncbi:50S ribosomal protein L23 [Candidatus Saccharibacteria bacterium]|nr:50S ribosomal protein L23 [Candidatus Saccharibacteria bacterium]
MFKLIALKPRLSEKAYAASETLNTYVFDVPAGINKFEVARAVTSQYKVGVQAVRLNQVAPKPLRSYKRRGKFVKTARPASHKAYVTLKDGDKLPFFADSDNSSKKEKK